MNLPRYPKYKPSGVEWIGEVPEGWEVTPLRHIVSRSDHKVEADTDSPLPYVGMEHVESWTGRLLPLDSEKIPSGISNKFEAGQTLFGKLRPYLAKACNLDFEGLCSSEFLVLTSRRQDRHFLLYCLLAEGFISIVDSSTFGAKMPRASWDFIGMCEIPIPPLPEQRAIATFLDERTGTLDGLIARKRALIEKLKEKRAAMISRTVTKGLPPEAAREAGFEPHPKMKPSGVEWIGEVPEGWTVHRLAPITFKIGSGKTPPGGSESYVSDGVMLIRSQNVHDDGLRLDDVVFIDDETDSEMANSRVKPDDVLLNITGASIGRCAIMPSSILRANVNQHVCIIRIDRTKAFSRYIM